MVISDDADSDEKPLVTFTCSKLLEFALPQWSGFCECNPDSLCTLELEFDIIVVSDDDDGVADATDADADADAAAKFNRSL